MAVENIEGALQMYTWLAREVATDPKLSSVCIEIKSQETVTKGRKSGTVKLSLQF